MPNSITQRILNGDAYNVTVAGNSNASPLNSAQIWSLVNGSDDVLVKSLAAGESYVLGPYYNETNFRIIYDGNITVSNAGSDFSSPASLMIKLTQSEYDALSVKNPATLYLIQEA